MSNMGRALMGTGLAKGQNRARAAAEMAITSPLLDDISVDGATGILINVVGGSDLKMREIQEAASLIQEQAHEDANIIFGASIDETLGENVKVTVIATGFEMETQFAAAESARAASQAPQSINQMSPQLQGRHPSQPPVSRGSYMPPATMREPQRPQVRPVAAANNGSEARIAAAAPVSQVARSTSFPSLDTDWDVPAFQRRGQ
jgi:cell division protein FtsZ